MGQRLKMTHHCQECGEAYHPFYRRQKCCSKACGLAASAKNNRPANDMPPPDEIRARCKAIQATWTPEDDRERRVGLPSLYRELWREDRQRSGAHGE